MTPARSGIAPENYQEVLDAEANATNAKQEQYLTPDWLVEQCASRLPMPEPATVLDPQCGGGALVNLGWWSNKYGIDVDNRLELPKVSIIHGNCVKVAEAMDDLYPDLHWDCANANPPFGRRWKVGPVFSKDGVQLSQPETIDSTLWTWRFVTRRANFGFFISNNSTLAELGIIKHPWVYHHEERAADSIWKGVRSTLRIGIVWWKNPHPRPVNQAGAMSTAWHQLQRVVDQEKAERPPFNIYLDPATGYLRTYLSIRSEIKQSITVAQVMRLHRVDQQHPLTLTTDKETRDLMRDLVECGIYTIQPEAKAAVDAALAEVNSVACPIMPITDFERVAYADEEETLECIKSCKGNPVLTAGKKYRIHTGSYRFTERFTRNKVHFSEMTGTTYTAEHTCELSGQDRYIQLIDDKNRVARFQARPKLPVEHDDALLWDYFKKPEVLTLADVAKDKIEQNIAILRSCEMLAGFDYYPGQMHYLAPVAAKDSALVAAATGAGKTLMAISLLALKTPHRALIIAPQGTMRASEDDVDPEEEQEEYNASQWVKEINRFAPYLQIFELFSYADYERICSLNGGELPPGVYVSYYEAMFTNRARENAPESWDDEKLNKYLWSNFQLPPLPAPEGDDEEDAKKKKQHFWCDTIGIERHGVRSIISPCMATLIGRHFDMVIADEAHKCTNLGAMVTQMLIRLQPRYRWALTATPIPNIVSNLFSLMGWIAVPGWYKGGIRNAAWPYSREEINRFNQTFLSMERDYTQEEMNKAADPNYSGKVIKTSPVIAAPARLLKILKPSMAYISKEACNPKYIPPKVVDVRVPLGHDQAKLYAYYLDRGHIPAKNALVRARKQTAWLRNICADPAGFSHGTEATPRVSSNMNPKVIAMLELTRDILAEREQVVIINSRVGLTDTLQHKLAEAGVPIARIDSTINPDQHAYQSNLFKGGKGRVMLMGIRCAAAYSFDQCKYLIVGSLEYSPGPLNQAIGRIDRVTNAVEKTIWIILHKTSIEEVQYDIVATKDDAATICLKGKRTPRDFKPVDGSEILATAINRFDLSGSTPEGECEAKWPALCDAIRKAARGY